MAHHKYNVQPRFWREISPDEFSRSFFQYHFPTMESRQMSHDSDDKPLKERINSVRLFPISWWDGIGIAIAHTKKGVGFYKYGSEEEWNKMETKFAAQFAGDNS